MKGNQLAEQSGKVWISGDDPSSAASATVTITSDDRVIVHIGGQVVADWPTTQVMMTVDGDTTELSVGDDRLLFEPDEPGPWRETVSAVQMRVRLSSTAPPPVPEVSNVESPAPAIMAPTSYCSACGRQIDPRAEVCVHCGVRQRSAPSSHHHKDRVTAGVLALFLGGLGVHRFYLGQIGLGVIYLVFFWTFIPAIVALVDAIILFTMSDAKFDAKFNDG